LNAAVEQKRRLRVELKSRRARVAPADAAAAARGVSERVSRDLRVEGHGTVAGYWPMGDELDIRPTLAAFHACGRAIALPVVLGRGRPLVFRSWQPGDVLVAGGFGTSVPAPDRGEISPGLLLVPLLGFDRRGNRLGYGGGFYDRTLAALRAEGPVLAIGFAWAAQEDDDLPLEATDQPLDLIVTEAEVITPAPATGQAAAGG
jgi:5-formyltetrahydrofolate cyclo-ligase